MSSRRTQSCRLMLLAIVLPAIFAVDRCAAAEPPSAHDQSHVVRRPVIETSSREEQYVLYEPVTTFVPQQVDQGAWVDQQVVRPGRTSIELRWMSGGWTVDPATGREYWQLPMLRPVRVRRPDTMEVVRVWKPNMVTLSVPKVNYQPRLHTRQVPVQTLRVIDERRVRRWPCPCGPATVAPAAASGPGTPLGAPPAFPAPLPSMPQPNIDPLEKVPEPATLSPSKTGEQSGPAQWRDAQQDRVASGKQGGNGSVDLQPRNRAT